MLTASYLLDPGVEGVPLLGVLPMLEPLLVPLLGVEELEDPELMPELDEPELMPLEVPPLDAPCSFFWCASHSARLIWPSWLVSILSNSSLRELEAPADALPELDGALDEDVPPAADDVPPVDDAPLDDGVLLCDVDGEALELELDLSFASSA